MSSKLSVVFSVHHVPWSKYCEDNPESEVSRAAVRCAICNINDVYNMRTHLWNRHRTVPPEFYFMKHVFQVRKQKKN